MFDKLTKLIKISDSSHNSTLILDPVLAAKSPRGSHTILAQQIDQEINELRNFFEDHREEMLSLLSDQQAGKRSMTSAGCSPIVFENSQKSPKRANITKRRQMRRNQFISDSEESRDVQEERRQEFEKFKQKKQRRKPQFALGQPLSNNSENNRISALFPNLRETQDLSGRHVPTVDGDQIFIPKLNLDDQWSMEDNNENELVQNSDKSCQIEQNIPQHSKRKSKRKKKKSQV